MAAMSPLAAPSNPVGRVAHRVATAAWFTRLVLAVIGVNALVMAVETYGHHFDTLTLAFWWFYCAELAIRVLAFGSRPQRFFLNGWNVFDFVIVVAVALPFIQGYVAAIRILRLLRVMRVLSLIPDLRVIIRGLVRSVAPMAGVTFLTLILMFLYAMAGNALLGEDLPERWGNVGSAMLTMLGILTLDSWSATLDEARAVTPLAVPFLVSFVLVGGFVVLNIVIAVVINSVEEARRLELSAGRGRNAHDGAADERNLEQLLTDALRLVQRDEADGPAATVTAAPTAVTDINADGRIENGRPL